MRTSTLANLMLNPLDHPICLSYPLRLVQTAWAEHVPFAMFLVDRLRPRTIVELGTFSGVSYCAFCQAVKELGLTSRCYAIDTWEGDPQTGFFGSDVLDDLKQHHDSLYSGFSTLIQSTFDEAVSHFADSTIDLLHIDGYHTYDIVKHDFDTWLPKLSSRGVILMHDINVRERDFGVWKLWRELKLRYPHFELIHEHGLGLLAVGDTYDDSVRELFELSESDRTIVRQFFTQLGQRLRVRLERDHTVKTLSWQIDDKQKIIESLTPQLAQKDEAIEWLNAQLAEKEEAVQALSLKAAQRQGAIESLSSELAHQRETDVELATRLSEARIVERQKIIRSHEETLTSLKSELAEFQKKSQRLAASNELLKSELAKKEQQNQRLSAQVSALDARLERIVTSLGWRFLSRYGRIKYPYLLPVYRLLGLMPNESKKAEESGLLEKQKGADLALAVQLPELDWAAHVLAADESKQPDHSEPEQEEKFDFYESLTLRPHLMEEELPAILEKSPPDEPSHRADVICFSIIDWEFRYQRPQQVMSQFASNGHRVFYISTSRFQQSDAVPRVQVSEIKENVYEVQLAAARPVDVYGEVVEGANRAALLASLDELRRTFCIEEAIGYVMIASWGGVALEAKQLWHWRVVYDCMDEWENFPGIKRGLLDMEVELVRRCDLLVVTGQLLYEKWQKYERPIVLARNAVDWDFYAEHCRPNTILAGIKHPVIGYYGAIADWFDIELLTEAARQRPDYTFVLLGGVFDVNVTKLKALPNVRILGQQPYESMPRYLYHFDVCMIPFKINPITEATDPVKVYEYLSAGKPVVTVALPELEPLRDYLYIAEDKNDFILQLDKAVAENDSELIARRRRLARQHTWKERYTQIETTLTDVIPRASVIVITYNNLLLNKLCLESIIRNTEYPNYEVIVVDNNSIDGTPAYLRYMAARYPGIHVILNPTNNGFARANNQGIAQSTGEYLVLLNNDTIVPPGWLSRLLRHLQNPAVGVVGPVTNFVGNEAKIDVAYQTWGEMETLAREFTWAHENEVADIHMLAMFCVAFRRETYERIGPLDEQFGIGMFEDDDYAQRIKAHGLRVVCAADVFVHHFGQAAFKKLIDQGGYNELFERNRRLYEMKWKIEWIPHKNAPLQFEPHTMAASALEIAAKK